MRTQLAIAGVVLSCLWLGSPILAQDKPQGTPLTGAELKTLIGNGVLLDWENPQGRKGTTMLLTTGVALRVYLHTFVGQGVAEEGTWRIDGDSVCLKWNVPGNDEELCSRYHRLGENHYEGSTPVHGRPTSMQFSVRK